MHEKKLILEKLTNDKMLVKNNEREKLNNVTNFIISILEKYINRHST